MYDVVKEETTTHARWLEKFYKRSFNYLHTGAMANLAQVQEESFNNYVRTRKDSEEVVAKTTALDHNSHHWQVFAHLYAVL